MDNYTIYCTEGQTKKALGLGAPIKLFCKDYMQGHINYIGSPIPIGHVLINDDLYYAPTTEQMIGWLEEQKLSLTIYNNLNITFAFELNGVSDGRRYSTRKGATLAAIDFAFEYLSINKKND